MRSTLTDHSWDAEDSPFMCPTPECAAEHVVDRAVDRATEGSTAEITVVRQVRTRCPMRRRRRLDGAARAAAQVEGGLR